MGAFSSTPDDNKSVKTFLAGLNTLVQICIGATNMAIIYFAFSKNNVHSGLCCIGYNFFMAEAILTLNPTNAWTAFLTIDQKRFLHLFLQLCAMIFALTGSLHIIVEQEFNVKYAHAVLGVIALCSVVLTFLLGPIALFNGVKSKTVHITVGIPTYGFAIVSLILGVLKPEFQDWAGVTNTVILITIVVVHSVIIVVMVFLKCIKRIMND